MVEHMSKYRFLISGAGSAGLTCAQVAAADGRGIITGVFDPVSSQLANARARFPEAIVSDDYPRLLETVRPDAVVVAGPDHLHADQAVLALEHGCHVLVEKPFATSVADAKRILDAARRHDRQVMADQSMRYVYPWREMVQAARSGQIGDLFFVQGDYIHDMHDIYSPNGSRHTPWRIDPVHPQNILLGGGIHPIDLILWAVESPVDEVYGYSNKKSAPEFPADDCYILVMRFANGVIGKCFVTSGCSGPRWHPTWHRFFEAYGAKGIVNDGMLHRRGEEPVRLEDRSSKNVAGGHGWAGSVTDFLDLLDGKIDNPVPGRQGARSVAVCEALLRAVQTGQPQKPEAF
jgi:predicted dehydrogenase